MQYHQSVWRLWMCHALAVPGCISEWLHCPKWSKNGSSSRMISRKKPRSSVWVTSCFSSTPSSIWLVLVCTVTADEVVDGVVGVDGLPGVTPEPVDHVVLHDAGPDEVVVHVGDLQLLPAGWLQGRDHLEVRPIVEVHTRHSEGAGRVL